MSAFDELLVQCRRRGWRVGVGGSYPDGRNEQGFVVNALEVRDRERALLASAVADPGRLDEAAVDCARALERQGLIP